jgi:uncharacterized ferritin-like protein (DUF455 family)
MTSVALAARTVLLTAEARAKAAASRAMAAAWGAGAVELAFDAAMPTAPARPAKPELLPPNRMPKRGRAGSERSRFALLHALAHIELNAIDLAWDLIGRFGGGLPRAFVDDWVKVGDDEARHFLMLDDRLRELGGAYGDLPAHDGLWQAAEATAHDLSARLAVVPQVLEARGLDVTPATVARLRAAGDDRSAAILEIIYRDEIAHVAAGNRWFRWACDSNGSPPAEAFRRLVSTYFRGELKPPFNDLARAQAGLTPDFYHDLASRGPA